jgi:hypothetical protein
MSYGRYKRILLLQRVEATTARMQKVPSHGSRKEDARLKQPLKTLHGRCRSVPGIIKATNDTPPLEGKEASAYVNIDIMEEG